MIAGQAERIVHFNNYLSDDINSGGGLIVTFTSGKGGTGKSFTAINMAYLAALKKKVLLVDFNLNFSGLGTMLNIIPGAVISDFLESKALFEDLIYKYSSNLHLIMGDAGNITNNTINEEDIFTFTQKINLIRADYDYIFFDCAPGAAPEVISAIKNSDLNIIVGNTEPTSVMDAYALIKISVMNSLSSENYVLFNKCMDENDASTASGNLKKAVSHFLKTDIKTAGFIPFQKDIMVSLQKQEIYLKENPSSKIVAKFEELMNQLDKIRQLANSHH